MDTNNTFPILSWRRIIIDGKETPYIISDKGIVMNDIRGEFMLITLDNDNYPTVKLFIDGEDRVCKVHRLCANVFHDNPFNLPEVDHIDRNHWNSDKDNLEFVTGAENMRRLQKSREIEKIQLANYASGDSHYSSKYTPSQILQVCMRLTMHERVSIISRKTQVDVRTIYLIKAGKIWKNISCYFSFNNDGFLTEEIINKIKEYGNEGITSKMIAHMLNFPYQEYFINIIEDIVNLT